MHSALTLCAASGALTPPVLRNLGLLRHETQWLAEDTAAVLLLDAAMEPNLPESLGEAQLDWRLTSQPPAPAKLFLADMDSTMITVECIDELADYAGVKAQVSDITERAMRGELDFHAALTERVALLEGLPVSVLEDCYESRVSYSAGAHEALAGMKAAGCRCVLVSGGFTFFTERVANTLGFDKHRANTLGVTDGILTGQVVPPVSDAATKLTTLKEECTALGISRHDGMAVGDGANDIPMLEAAGIGVAYHAKPKTKAAAGCAIDHSDLRALLAFQGLSFQP